MYLEILPFNLLISEAVWMVSDCYKNMLPSTERPNLFNQDTSDESFLELLSQF
jgi:hypothetical protein